MGVDPAGHPGDLATIVASQALISGVFSLTNQAIQLGFIPRLEVRHTSADVHGQVYLPAVNWTLLVACLGLVLGFRSSANLAAAYGLAVTATMLITTILARGSRSAKSGGGVGGSVGLVIGSIPRRLNSPSLPRMHSRSRPAVGSLCWWRRSRRFRHDHLDCRTALPGTKGKARPPTPQSAHREPRQVEGAIGRKGPRCICSGLLTRCHLPSWRTCVTITQFIIRLYS